MCMHVCAKVKCIIYFRDFNPVDGNWNTKGCELNREKSTQTKAVCECNHLTHFAILLSPVAVEQVSVSKSFALINMFLTVLIYTLSMKHQLSTLNRFLKIMF